MTLLEFAKQRITPTADQEKLFEQLDDFIQSPIRCFLLKGYAGTGKTTITKIIAEYFESISKMVSLMAPTGRAAVILSEKTKRQATTIHSGIYDMSKISEHKTKVDGEFKYYYRFKLREERKNLANVFMIDEASMISDKLSKQEFYGFGSGILLKDIVDYVGLRVNMHKTKLIFIGDNAQLPPVTDNISGALSADYLEEKYGFTCMEYELTQVVRQAEESAILDLATETRQRLKGEIQHFQIPETSSDIEIINKEEISNQYKALNPNLEIDKTVIINYSNKEAYYYNKLIRESFFNNSYQISARDLVVMNKNARIDGEFIANGLMGKILWVEPVAIVRSNIPSYTITGEKIRIDLKFRRVVMQAKNIEKSFDCLILENALYSDSSQLTYQESIALYLDFKIRNPGLKANTKEFKKALIADPYFNALQVKYGYAITCHKAQGGEWDEVIVNLNLPHSKTNKFFNRWFYTAITRARSKLYIFNYEKETIFSKLKLNLNYDFVSHNKSSTESLNFVLPANFNQLLIQFDLENEEAFKIEKFKEILARIETTDYKLIARSKHNYQEQYTFLKDDKNIVLSFWYNGKNQFTRITIFQAASHSEEFKNEILELFEAPRSISYIEKGGDEIQKSTIAVKEQKEILFEDAKDNIKDLFEAVLFEAEPLGITISEISHLQYHEKYTFTRASEKLVMLIYYNNEGFYTNAFNLPKESNSHKLLTDVESLFNKLINK